MTFNSLLLQGIQTVTFFCRGVRRIVVWHVLTSLQIVHNCDLCIPGIMYNCPNATDGGTVNEVL
jgi:hypothetical protein